MGKIKFRSEDWVNASPPFFGENEYGNRYPKWNTQTVPIQLPSTDHRILKLTLKVEAGAPPIGYFHLSTAENSTVTYRPITTGFSGGTPGNLYQPFSTLDLETGIAQLAIDKYYDIRRGTYDQPGDKEYLINVNSDRNNLSTELQLDIAVGNYAEYTPQDYFLSASIDCNFATVTTYNAGMHPYSAYNAISESSTYTTKLYQYSGLAQDSYVYSSPDFTKPALPYYYGVGSNVYKVGSNELDRNYATVGKWKAYRKWFGKEVEFRFEGPTSNWYIEGERREEPSTRLLWSEFHNDYSYKYTPQNIVPFMGEIGIITDIVANSSIPEPSVYRYYMTYGSTAAQALNQWSFWDFDKEFHLTMNGELNALKNLGSMVSQGLTSTRNWDWYTVKDGTQLRYRLLLYPVSTDPASPDTITPFLLLADIAAYFAPNVDSVITRLFNNVFKDVVVYTSKGGTVYSLGVVLWIVAVIVFILVTFKARWYMEKQKALRNVFCANPTISTGNSLYKDENLLTQVDNEYYSDGFYYYNYSGNVTAKDQQAITGIVDFEEGRYANRVVQNKTATAPDSSTEVTEWQKLITLPYVCGKPVPGKTVGAVTTWSSGGTSGTVGYPVGTFARQQYTSVEVEEGFVTSFISQADADQKANRILSASMKFITGSSRPAIVDNEYLISSSVMYFTHTLKVENYSKQVDVYYTGSLTTGTTLYYDPEGRVKVFNGYYSTGSSGSNFRDYYLVESGSILKEEILASSGSTTSLSGQPVDTTFQDYTSAWAIKGNSKPEAESIGERVVNNRFFDATNNELTVDFVRAIASGSVRDPENTLVKVYSGSRIYETGSFLLPSNDWYQDITKFSTGLQRDVFSSNVFSLPEKTIRPTFAEDCTWQSGSATERGVYVRFLTGSGGVNRTNPVYDVDLSFEVNTSTGTAGTYRVTVPGNRNQIFVPLIDSNFTPGDYFTSITLDRIFSPNPNRGVTIETGSILSKRCQAPTGGSETIFISAIRDNCDDLCWQSGDTSYLVNNSSNSTETYALITIGTYITDVAGNVPNYVGYVAVAASSTQTSDTSNVKILEVDNFGFVSSIVNCSGGTCTNPL